jgi:hypothetical protein
MRADEVLLKLVQRDLGLPGDYMVELLRHEVSLNWRQRYPNPRRQISALRESLRHDGPFDGTRFAVHGLHRSLAEQLATTQSALSITSRVWNGQGEHVGHLALMNLHPVGFRAVREMRAAIEQVTDGLPGYLLASGRYFHFYGKALLTVESWLLFLAQFLMPCVLVSPRYVGHSLHRGFCTLRLNSVSPVKPSVPRTTGY